MKYVSTRDNSKEYNFEQVFIKGLADDGGLYVPISLKKYSPQELQELKKLSYNELSTEIINLFSSDFISKEELSTLIKKSYSTFREKEVVKISNVGDIKLLELFHGPTLAFKDFGARFMARTMEKVVQNNDKEINILVATSGDTGSAVANGFYDVEGINVIILYPSGKVSNIQEKQLTTLDKNIFALEVNGTFDDCQALVKKAFLDNNLKSKLEISSANSINIARLIPQSFYYFSAFSKFNNDKLPLVVSVPSGNFGNLTAGIFAKHMGLPIKMFIASTNSNKTVSEYLMTGEYNPNETIPTISNAMDVGNPSNMKRIINLYKNIDAIKKDLKSFSISDNDTIKIISNILDKYNYLLDPHSAVGMLGLLRYLNNTSIVNGLFLGTAHPAKFADIIEPEINKPIDMPKQLYETINKKKNSTLMNNNYNEFSDYLLSKFQ